jgi:ribonuclease T
MARRFRGFLPIIVDVETGGFNADTDALLEIAAVTLRMSNQGLLERKQTVSFHIEPFPGANLEPASLQINGIDPYHPFRFARPEPEVLQEVLSLVRSEVKAQGCTRAVLVGHNAFFDLNFLNAAARRARIKRNPFHPFTSFDTATLSGLAFGQTVLARAVEAAGLSWNPDEAHSAIYDAERTAELFRTIVNRWLALGGWPPDHQR